MDHPDHVRRNDEPYRLPKEHTWDDFCAWSYSHIIWRHNLQKALWVLDRYNLEVRLIDHISRSRKTLRILHKVELREGVIPPFSEEEPLDLFTYTHPLSITLSDQTIERLADKFDKSQKVTMTWIMPCEEVDRLEKKYGIDWFYGTDHLDIEYEMERNPYLWLETV